MVIIGKEPAVPGGTDRPKGSRTLVNRLSSLTLSFTLMTALTLWMGIGILLTYHPATDRIIKSMNDQLILSWLLTATGTHPLMSLWLLVLLGLSGLLLLNLACCCLTLPGLKIRFKSGPRSMLLLILHVLTGLVMVGHGAHMIAGFKAADMKLLPGKSAGLPDGTTIHLESVECSYIPLLEISGRQQRRQSLTRDRVKLKDNYIDFTIQKEGQIVDSGRAYMLRPFRRGAFRVTLNRFFPLQKSGPPLPGRTAGAVVTVAENSFHELFFCLYAAMIICFLAYWIVVEVEAKR